MYEMCERHIPFGTMEYDGMCMLDYTTYRPPTERTPKPMHSMLNGLRYSSGFTQPRACSLPAAVSDTRSDRPFCVSVVHSRVRVNRSCASLCAMRRSGGRVSE